MLPPALQFQLDVIKARGEVVTRYCDQLGSTELETMQQKVEYEDLLNAIDDEIRRGQIDTQRLGVDPSEWNILPQRPANG